MANDNKKPQQAQKQNNQQAGGKARPPKKGGSKGGPQLSPKERHDNWTKSKLDKAGKDEYTVVSQKTRDVAMFVNLANSHDNIMNYLRSNVMINPRITMEAFGKIINLSNEAKILLNKANEEAYKLAGRDYKHPRGIRELDREMKQVAGAKKAQENTAEAAAAPAVKKAEKAPKATSATAEAVAAA